VLRDVRYVWREGGVLDLFQVQKSCRILRDFYCFSFSKGEAWNIFHEISSKIFVE
jgi:hypothetical protein